jgi:hypothetical protein
MTFLLTDHLGIPITSDPRLFGLVVGLHAAGDLVSSEEVIPGVEGNEEPVSKPSRAFLSMDEAAKVLGMSGGAFRRTILHLEREGPHRLRPRCKGQGSRRKHRIFPNDIDKLTAWWREVQAWQASTREATSTRSSGVIPMADRGRAPARTSGPRRASGKKSKKRLPAGDDGNLATIARGLADKKSS